MKKLTEEEILAVWESVTDFTGGWDEAIAEVLSRIEDLSVEWSSYNAKDRISNLKQRLLDLRDRIEEAADAARAGEFSIQDLENLFREYGERLEMIEEELLEMEFDEEEDEDFFGEEEEEY
ncbi:MAG: hypothetical protein DRQ10_08275 [Candidatus Hydrothermota bacterium]|nr:MAG: hypothetical protein DRQ10_08275 [Candidatus Hydrothermae bacterium]